MTSATTYVADPDVTGDVPARRRPRRRSDIEGLRAVAVLLVLAFHAGIPALRGGFVGVDVFFVISGYLITGLLVREAAETGTIDLRRFWARRARRLLPATTVVLAAVGLITVFLLPATRWKTIAYDMLAGAIYVVNWRLAERSVDYSASEEAASPVQHFWSLAVEEQFYLVWPVLILAVVLAARRRGNLPRLLMAVVALVIAGSLAWSVHATGASPSWAYFVSTTRVWELGVGAALAIGSSWVERRPVRWASPMAWAGLLAIIVAALAYDSSTRFPGVAALLPTGGAALLIGAGLISASNSGARLLATAPLQVIGGLSYSLYLWHWPFVVAATAVWGEHTGSISWPYGVAATLLSVLPAWLTYHYVEKPVHFSQTLERSPGAALAVGAVCTAVAVGCALILSVQLTRMEFSTAAPAVAGTSALGARSVDRPSAGPPVDSPGEIFPSPLVAAEDVTDWTTACEKDSEGRIMRWGCRGGRPGAAFTVALVGDSHVWQWEPALELIAGRRGWELRYLHRSSCPFLSERTALPLRRNGPDTCADHAQAVLERLSGADAPDVVLSGSKNQYLVWAGEEWVDPHHDPDPLTSAYALQWAKLRELGIDHVRIRETPWMDVDVPECVLAAEDFSRACATDRQEAVRLAGSSDAEAARQVGVPLVDMTDHVCPAGRCPPVVGNVLVWRDRNHLTATYARTLAQPLEERLLQLPAFADAP